METLLNEPAFLPPAEPRPNFLRSAEPTPIIAPMTVGIAVICEEGKAIVMAADRLITVGEASLVTEVAHPKLKQLSPNLWLTITGSVQQYEYALERFEGVSQLVRGNSIHRIARRFRKACHRIRAKILQYRFTEANLGITYEDFSKQCMDNPTTNIMSDIYNKMLAHPFDMLVLMAGIDDRGPHIYLINDMTINSFKAMGYAAIGIGAVSATVSLAGDDNTYYPRTVAETLYRTYEAKRVSEQTALVAKTTDMVVIRQAVSPYVVTEADLAVLERIYQSRKRPAMTSEEIAAIEKSIGQ